MRMARKGDPRVISIVVYLFLKDKYKIMYDMI